MQLLNAVQNEAILSNVSEIGEFRIRNSAKAFNILSSGLYANKIRAIVRELSCNAIDSHVAAGKGDVPFEAHLPTQFEPWFAIRDFGTGLSHEQVTNIYTTYFESTKTASNDFIGALGLGSKSPFSYTDNFTVTAVQNGRKGVYSAFINEAGVPSIALMMEEETTDANGVEVKFSVNDRWDFDKFKQEARNVYKWFKQRPVITGVSDFQIEEIDYEDKDIVPGIHSRQRGYGTSVAIMGNIAYPIEVPQADQTLGALRKLLGCGLVIEFKIGELDFQASREGLSYIPQTIASIKARLEELNGALAGKLASEADLIVNQWEKALFLGKRVDKDLWNAAVKKYIADTGFDLLEDRSGYIRTKRFQVPTETLQKDFNIIIRGFTKTRGSVTCSAMNPDREYDRVRKDANGHAFTYTAWHIGVSDNAQFVINDTKIGALERAKNHWRKTSEQLPHHSYVYVIEPFDRAKAIKSKEFFELIKNPPECQIRLASSLMEKERASSGVAKNVTILKLSERGYGGYYREKEMVWKDAGKADQFDDKQTFYYVPLKGFQMDSSYGYGGGKELWNELKEAKLGICPDTIYGVRKSDIEFIKTQKNWVNLETFVKQKLDKVTKADMIKFAVNLLDNTGFMRYNNSIVNGISNPNSPYVVFMNKVKDIEPTSYNEYSMKRLFNRFKVTTVDPVVLAEEFRKESNAVQERYPLLSCIHGRTPEGAVVEYINMIDTQKGV